MNLDKFIWNRAALTPEIRQKLDLLAKEVKLSWTTMRPIGYVILIGHTDNTGPEAYNHDLGDWRAGEVKKALEILLRDEILNRRVAIVVERSPGASSPTARQWNRQRPSAQSQGGSVCRASRAAAVKAADYRLDSPRSKSASAPGLRLVEDDWQRTPVGQVASTNGSTAPSATCAFRRSSAPKS